MREDFKRILKEISDEKLRIVYIFFTVQRLDVAVEQVNMSQSDYYLGKSVPDDVQKINCCV